MESLGDALILNKSNEKLYGYYNVVVPNFSCVFFIYGENANENKINITTYDTDSSYRKRVKNFDIPGYAFERSDHKWQITTENEQAGCGGAVGSFIWDDDRAAVFSMVEKYPAIGIRVIKKKSLFHDKINENFVPRKGYLVASNVVVVLKEYGKFSFVKYSNPLNEKKISGWISSNHLENPFPDAPSHLGK